MKNLTDFRKAVETGVDPCLKDLQATICLASENLPLPLLTFPVITISTWILLLTNLLVNLQTP